ncbi:esterase/PHB depolymerase [Pseudoduganella flava]|uniref:Depolymerase n=1 Tax=Pseudoduganella flava TaxID=871742 RepID=A0A562PKE2_9BURK|nr:PHB depolymerase family esterase [Pseudoduganella flava]QGZ42361.1 depolymerase [Pseudoduganella flava]TWI44922.1 esterase/PHB depolymerase [Pseudoduganella flava]
MKLSTCTLARALALALALPAACPAAPRDPLPALAARPDATSVSGLSSGAFMAVQYQVAYSSSVTGAGIVAGGPYYCAAGMLFTYVANCMGVPMTMLVTSPMAMAARNFATIGVIDSLDNLKKARVYIFSGTNDTVVYQPAVDAAVTLFEELGVKSENLRYVNTTPAGHALLTPGFGNSCEVNETPYISQCQQDDVAYDQPGAILAHIYGPLNPPTSRRTGRLLAFDQREFAAESTSMADEAYAYVPQRCTDGAACRVHVAFHGCLQSQKFVQDDFYNRTSYNDWADTNDIIVLYPQVNDSQPWNQNGCWDWIGYTGPGYAFKGAPQMKAIRAMIARLTAPRGAAPVALNSGAVRLSRRD